MATRSSYGKAPGTRKYLGNLQADGGRSNRTALQNAAAKHYTLNRIARGGYSGYGPAATAAMQATPDTYQFNPDTGVATAGGVTPTTPSTPTTGITAAYEEAAMKLAQALRGVGIDWTRTAGQAYAPPASLIGGTGWKRIQNMPSLYTLMLQGRAASGQPAPDYLAEIGQFQHTAPAYSTVNYGW